MHHFFDVLRKYAVFTGRAGRGEFWWFTLVYLILIAVAAFVDVVIGTFDAVLGFGLFSGSLFVATLLPMLGVHVRRLHDTGRSGWWLLLGLVPVVGSFALFILVLFASQPGTNEYGAHPRPTQQAGADAPRVLPPSRARQWRKGTAMLAGLTLVLAGAVRYVWAVHGDYILAAGKVSMDEGRRAGLSLGESGCLADAMRRHGADHPVSLASSVSNGLRLSGCLESSRFEARFCERVPAQEDMLAAATWGNAACTLQGFSDAYCQNIFQSVVRYCASADRGDKSEQGRVARGES
jgi:uncharacterized membrane protein YhaH (DUF805 family)